MDKKIWDNIVLIVVVSNAVSIVILFETLIFHKPFISLFALIFYMTYKINMRFFSRKRSKAKKQVMEMEMS